MPQCQDHNRSPADQDNNLGHQHLSPSRGCRDNRHWDSSYSEPGNRPLDRRDLNPETRPTECRNLSPGRRLPERCAFSPDAESLVPPGYGSMSRPVDHRVRSPDRLIHSSSTQRFPASYAGQRTNGEEIIPIAEYRREVSTIRLKVWQLFVCWVLIFMQFESCGYNSTLSCRFKQDTRSVCCTLLECDEAVTVSFVYAVITMWYLVPTGNISLFCRPLPLDYLHPGYSGTISISQDTWKQASWKQILGK